MEQSISTNVSEPAILECEENSMECNGSRRALGSETILVVEDEEALLGLVELLLKDAGYNVITARDGQEAVEAYSRHRTDIDLVFTDMGLPTLCGKDELLRLKQINPDARVVLSSGYLDPKLTSEMIRAGANAFVSKPFAPEDVLKAVRNVLDSRSSNCHVGYNSMMRTAS